MSMCPNFLRVRNSDGTDLFINTNFIILIRRVPTTKKERDAARDAGATDNEILDLYTFELYVQGSSTILSLETLNTKFCARYETHFF
jgi:hypothetical protein